ncbi:MAG: response regulator [Verrucomicrobia bacterium]|nr:response regulator [Verrucomicrobiota bacterium]MDE3098434.1 response regulator [Verrucomicrobiota bacterium]
MENQYDYKKFAILYVDDEEKSLKNFSRAFGGNFRLFTAPSAQEGYALLEQHADEIGLLMTDQRMPGEKGVWLLERARQLRPRILRILVTAFADMDAAIAAVNSGAIYKYVTKPWEPPQLELTLRQGLEFFMVQMERDQLLHEKMSILRNMMIADRMVSLGLIAAGLGHHIRNSLVAVQTFLELAPDKMADERASQNELRDPGFWTDYHQGAQEQIEKINNLLKEIWTASENPRTPFADKVSLRDMVEEAREKFATDIATRQIEIENNVPDSLPLLQVDKNKFFHVFEWLLKEELATLPSGKRLTFSAESKGSGRQAEMIIHIADNGPGLPQDALRAVFDPFAAQRAVASEYAIHLMACFFVVHHHGGTIDAHSEPGQGNTFTIHMPLHPEKAAPPPDDTGFFKRAVLNEEIWQKLLAGN